jgi:hypothetical protein
MNCLMKRVIGFSLFFSNFRSKKMKYYPIFNFSIQCNLSDSGKYDTAKSVNNSTIKKIYIIGTSNLVETENYNR